MKCLCVIALLLVYVRLPAQTTGTKRSLLVGVSRYDLYAELPAASHDALRVRDALDGLKFATSILAAGPGTTSITRSDLVSKLRELAGKCEQDDLLLLYFAGHGSRRKDRDYLLLSDTREDDPATKDVDEFKETAFALDEGKDSLAAILRSCKAKRRVIIIDACRDTSTRGDGKSGFKNGLDRNFVSRIDQIVNFAPPGEVVQGAVLYACSPGETSKEDVKTNAGLFTMSLVEALKGKAREPGGKITLGSVLRYVKGEVPEAAHQTPALSPAQAASISLGMLDGPIAEVPPAPPGIEWRIPRPAGPFKFKVVEVRAVNTQVTVTIEVENSTSDDHTFLILTVQHGGIASTDLRRMGVTYMVDSQGREYEAEDVQFANMSGGETGQSRFTVVPGTHPKLRLTFQNVGVAVTSIGRITLAIGEATNQGVRPLAVAFHNVPIQGRAPVKAGAPPPNPTVNPRFIVESADWRLTLKECRRVQGGVRCKLIMTNLSDAQNLFYFFWQGTGKITLLGLKAYGQTSAVDEEGNTYAVSGLQYTSVHHKTPVVMQDNGQTRLLADPFLEVVVEFTVSGVPERVKKLARLDLAVVKNSLKGEMFRIPAAMRDVPILDPE